MNAAKSKSIIGKKGFELSINFIVMLILAIVVFGFGLYFTGRLFTEAGEIKAKLDRDAEANIERMLDRGEVVAFSITSKAIKHTEVAIFGLGILNVLEGDTLTGKTEFEVTLECTAAVDKREINIAGGCDGKWTFDNKPSTPKIFDIAEFTLEKNEKKIIPIPIQVPKGKPDGIYGFTVTVKNKEGNLLKVYGRAPKQIYVTVE